MEFFGLIAGFFTLCLMTNPEWLGKKAAVFVRSYRKHMEDINEPK